MPDIELRFDKDMLVLSAPIDAVLARQGIDSARDRQYLNLMEPDVVQDALNLEVRSPDHRKRCHTPAHSRRDWADWFAAQFIFEGIAQREPCPIR